MQIEARYFTYTQLTQDRQINGLTRSYTVCYREWVYNYGQMNITFEKILENA